MNQHIKPNVGVSQACEQSLHLGKSREFTREPYAKEARGVREEGRAKKVARLRVLLRLASHAIIERRSVTSGCHRSKIFGSQQ